MLIKLKQNIKGYIYVNRSLPNNLVFHYKASVNGAPSPLLPLRRSLPPICTKPS